MRTTRTRRSRKLHYEKLEDRSMLSVWTGGTGSFDDPNKWDNGVPQPGDTAAFQGFDENSADLNQDHIIGTLQVRDTRGTTLNELNLDGFTLNAEYHIEIDVNNGKTARLAQRSDSSTGLVTTSDLWVGASPFSGSFFGSAEYDVMSGRLETFNAHIGGGVFASLNVESAPPGAQIPAEADINYVQIDAPDTGRQGRLRVGDNPLDGNPPNLAATLNSDQIIVNGSGRVDINKRGLISAGTVTFGQDDLTDQYNPVMNIFEGQLNVEGTFDIKDGEVTVDLGLLHYDKVINKDRIIWLRAPLLTGGAFENHGDVILERTGYDYTTINGDFDQYSDGTFKVELGGVNGSFPMQYFDYPSVNVTNGNVDLDGTLEVTLAPGYVPSYGDEYTLISFNYISGNFAYHMLPDLSSYGYEWQVNYTGTDVRLTVVEGYGGYSQGPMTLQDLTGYYFYDAATGNTVMWYDGGNGNVNSYVYVAGVQIMDTTATQQTGEFNFSATKENYTANFTFDFDNDMFIMELIEDGFSSWYYFSISQDQM